MYPKSIIYNKAISYLGTSIGLQRNIHVSSSKLLEKTVLYDYHCNNGAKMVPFAGYSMPVLYDKVGVSASHKHVRAACGLFDVSHMLQTRVHGPDRIEFLESLTVADIAGLKPNTGCLSLFTNEQGGIKDDLIITSTSDEYLYVVSNAGCRDKVLHLLKECLPVFCSSGSSAELEVRSQDALLALQGPLAAAVLQEQCSAQLSVLPFMNSVRCSVSGVDDCRVSRCGYTGEDGFELAIPGEKAEAVCRSLVASSVAPVQLAGLAARDSLRLEAGLCLYGNDITEETTPVEAGLAWTIAKRRRAEGGFPGAQVILQQLRDKPAIRRVGLTSGGPPARPPSDVVDGDGNTVGQVCSGCPSPSLGINVGMAYVPAALAKAGTSLSIRVRNKLVPATVTKMPFVKSNYYIVPQ